MIQLRPRWERHFHAMGTKCHIVVEGGRKSLLDVGQTRVSELAERWTRFSPNSEVSHINQVGPVGIKVSSDTFLLFQTALVAQTLTEGTCDAFMASEIAAAGYDRDYASLTRLSATPTVAEHSPRRIIRRRSVREAAARAGLRLLDKRKSTVRLPPGYALDSGGIGKGLAADLVSRELRSQGAVACLVNLGGDLRVRGNPQQGGWEISISDEVGQQEHELSVKLTEGGLCTSSLTRRRWLHDGVTNQHLLDPRTGQQVRSKWAAATAIAPHGWLAEALSKAALQLPESTLSALLRRHRAGVVQQGWDGSLTQCPR